MKRLSAVFLLGLAACAGTDPRQETYERIQALAKDEEAFQELLRAGGGDLDVLKDMVPSAPNRGFPAVALLYAAGEGDAVPLDLKARHAAAFRWPTAHADENALVEPAVWDELERDLLFAGRRSLGLLAGALAKDATDERGALRAARLMIRAGGIAAMEAFAGLLGEERRLGEDGPRVRDVAAAALLVLGLRDLPLRNPDPDAIARAARDWWEGAKERPESERLRDAVQELAALRAEKDPNGVERVLELLEGKGPRGEAFLRNRRLERETGLSAWAPAWERIGDLRATLRLWSPPEDLDLRWSRLRGRGLLRLSAGAFGTRPKDGAGALLWAREAHFHASEHDGLELRIAGEGYVLHIRARECGTRAVIGEFARAGDRAYAKVQEVSLARPFVLFSPILKSAMVIAVEEVEARRPPPPPDVVKKETRERAKAAEEGARALAYLRDEKDLPAFREAKAHAALLLLGDPAGLEGKPALEAWEIEMALGTAENPEVRAYLEGLKSARRR